MATTAARWATSPIRAAHGSSSPSFEPLLALQGAAGHWDHHVDEDYYSQPGALFRLFNAEQRQALFDNTARSLHGVASEIQQRHISHCTLADPAYGAGVAAALAALER
jgi:catalase